MLTASDGVIGLKSARTFRPDLSVLDIMLPKLDGLVLLLTACQAQDTLAQTRDTGGGMGMGISGMMTRHSAPIPEEYANLSSPVAGDEESLARGKEIFTTNCVVCRSGSMAGAWAI